MPAHSHTGIVDACGTHTHNTNDTLYGETNASVTQDIVGTQVLESNGDNVIIETDGLHRHTFTTDNTGSSVPISIMQPYFVLNYIIKT